LATTRKHLVRWQGRHTSNEQRDQFLTSLMLNLYYYLLNKMYNVIMTKLHASGPENSCTVLPVKTAPRTYERDRRQHCTVDLDLCRKGLSPSFMKHSVWWWCYSCSVRNNATTWRYILRCRDAYKLVTMLVEDI
jgi:hypothetical protein